MSVRILLVEDDPVSQDLLKSVLQARGYAVDAVGDGFTGLRLLKQQAYALVLVDYHLPELDGYASARLMREAAHNGVAPKLVAITADRYGLMARSGAEIVFDAILTKPVEPQGLFRFIETTLGVSSERASVRAAKAFLNDPRHDQARAAAEAFWRDRGLSGRPKALPTPEPTPEQALALSFCFDVGEPASADLIVLLDPGGIDRLPLLHERMPGRPTPVIDVTGHALDACDAAFRVNDPASWSEIAGLLQGVKARGARLTPTARLAADPDGRLLACLYGSDRRLRLAHDPSCRLPIPRGGWFVAPEAMLAAERLTARGLLSRQVVERPPGGLDFVYELTEAAVASLTASGSKPDGSGEPAPEPVRETLERAIREASKTFADARNAALEAEPGLAAGGGTANPIATLDRLFVQSVREVAAQAADKEPAAPIGPETAVRGGKADAKASDKADGKAPSLPSQPKPGHARVGPEHATQQAHDVQALLNLIAPHPSQPAPAPEPPIAPPPSQPAPVPEPRSCAGRILLAEDVDVNREIARAMLEASGYAVDAVASGAGAVAAVRGTSYGLVLMDVQMPDVDGLEATRRIRALPPPRRDVPIVGMSASASPDQIAAFQEAGMNDHVGKPFRREELAAAVERWRRPDPPASEPEPDAAHTLDRAVYDGLFDLVGRERVMALLGQLAAQLAERFAGETVSDEDRARLARDAHAMVSAAGVLGFASLSDACKSLEAACARGEDIGAHLKQVRASRAAALKAISALKQAA